MSRTVLANACGQTGAMRFECEHEFAASRAAVAAVLCDPDFQTQLALPDLSLPTVVSQSDDGTTRS